MSKTLKRPEVLSPAGTLEKLKVAIDYGADAVFVGGQAYGLRSRAGNFSMEQMREGIEYAHARGAKVYVAANMVTHEGNEAGAGAWFRWKYNLYDLPFGEERRSIKGEIPEEFSMSAVDMCMIDHIPDMIENGVDSLKIEGRMKSVHYVSTVTNCYKAAVDAYLESPEKFEAIKQDLIDEMWKVAQRELATGFYYSPPSENEQLFGARRKIPEYKFIGEVVAFDKDTMTATIRQRNVINEGDQVEFYGPGFRHFESTIQDLHDSSGNKIDRANKPMELLTFKLDREIYPGDMIRACKSGLINLYQEDGQSLTIRA